MRGEEEGVGGENVDGDKDGNVWALFAQKGGKKGLMGTDIIIFSSILDDAQSVSLKSEKGRVVNRTILLIICQ